MNSLPPPVFGAARGRAAGKEASAESAVGICREIIKDNIEYEHLTKDKIIDCDQLDAIVEIVLATVVRRVYQNFCFAGLNIVCNPGGKRLRPQQ